MIVIGLSLAQLELQVLLAPVLEDRVRSDPPSGTGDPARAAAFRDPFRLRGVAAGGGRVAAMIQR